MFRISLLVAVMFAVIQGVFAQDFDESPQEIRMERALEHAGDIGQFIPVAASATLMLIHKDDKGFWQFMKGMSANLALTYGLKYAIDKPRPDGATDGKAFPSGHTSFAFQGASFLQRRYGWEYGIPAYAIASFVAYSRIEGLNDRHDLIDVLGGALVGIGSTYLFTTPYQKEHFELSFSSTNQEYMVGLTFKF